jgi:hypothetical protein
VRQRPEQSVLEQEYVMRVPRPYTKLWVRANTLRQARYLEIIRKNDGVLGDKYFEDVDKRRSSAAGLRLIACAVQIPIFAFFVLSLIPIDANSSVLGVSPTSSKHLREILLVVSAVLALGTSFIGYHHDVLTEILAAHVEGRSKGDKDVQEMLKISYGIALFPLPPRTQGYLQLGRGFHLFVNIFAVLTAITLAILALGALYIRFKVLEDIYFAPSFSTTVSVWVIGFVVMCDVVGSLIFVLTTGPIIARNFEDGRTNETVHRSANVAETFQKATMATANHETKASSEAGSG